MIIESYQEFRNYKSLNEVLNWDEQNVERINEAGITAAVASVALSVPQMMKLLGKVIKWVAKKFGREHTSVGEWLEKTGEKLHHAILKLLGKIVRVVINLLPGVEISEKTANNIAHVLFYVLIAYLAGLGVGSIADKLGNYGLAKGIIKSVLKIVTTAIKNAELIFPIIALILIMNKKEWREKNVGFEEIVHTLEHEKDHIKEKGKKKYSEIYKKTIGEINKKHGLGDKQPQPVAA